MKNSEKEPSMDVAEAVVKLSERISALELVPEVERKWFASSRGVSSQY